MRLRKKSIQTGYTVNKKEGNKNVRRMPRLSKAKKDVISCEKLRGGANNL